jgi:ATP-dependent Lon protease
MNKKNSSKRKASQTKGITTRSKAKTKYSESDSEEDEQTEVSSLTMEEKVTFSKVIPMLFSPSSKQAEKKHLEERIMKSKMPSPIKKQVLDRFKYSQDDSLKHTEWFENLLRIPFGVYTPLPVSQKDKLDKIQSYFETTQSILDQSVYGLENVKEEFLNYIAQFISTKNESQPRIIGLKGSPGVGKSEICLSGLSKALKRPIQLISMGGITDSNHFCGFDFSYAGSRYGLIVQTLIEKGVMNPIFFFDELDKTSQSNDGIDIQNILIHITDPVQNMTFQDKYFTGIPIDLSRAIIVFSFNDEQYINPILRDRLHIITVPDPTLSQKLVIANQYLFPQICKNIGFEPNQIELKEEELRYLLQEYCSKEKGVRQLKKCIQTLLLKINTSRFLSTKQQKYKSLQRVPTFPLHISRKIIDELLADQRPNEQWYEHMFL